MITIFRDTESSNDLSPMFFDINGYNYHLYYRKNNVLSEYDIVLDVPNITYPTVKYKIFLQLDIFDNFENQGFANANNSRKEMYVISNAWDSNYISDKVIYNDFLFNRTKAYYQNYTFSPTTKLWYYRTKSAYSIPDQDVNLKTKIFVGPNNTWPNTYRTIKYRPQIFERLMQSILIGYIGNYRVDPSYFLIPNYLYPEIKSVNQLLLLPVDSTLLNQASRHNQFGYSPPHNAYYEDTFISVYGETIEYGTTVAPTEKTYDPLIKGHFILPFSCPGFIEFLKTKGFKFPTFIDYSYDSETNDNKRFNKYITEVDRLFAISLSDWQQHWTDNADLRAHNQKIFEITPYDRVDLHQLINLAKNA